MTSDSPPNCDHPPHAGTQSSAARIILGFFVNNFLSGQDWTYPLLMQPTQSWAIQGAQKTRQVPDHQLNRVHCINRADGVERSGSRNGLAIRIEDVRFLAGHSSNMVEVSINLVATRAWV
jgi:hypothetical protein